MSPLVQKLDGNAPVKLDPSYLHYDVSLFLLSSFCVSQRELENISQRKFETSQYRACRASRFLKSSLASAPTSLPRTRFVRSKMNYAAFVRMTLREQARNLHPLQIRKQEVCGHFVLFNLAHALYFNTLTQIVTCIWNRKFRFPAYFRKTLLHEIWDLSFQFLLSEIDHFEEIKPCVVHI